MSLLAMIVEGVIVFAGGLGVARQIVRSTLEEERDRRNEAITALQEQQAENADLRRKWHSEAIQRQRAESDAKAARESLQALRRKAKRAAKGEPAEEKPKPKRARREVPRG